MQEANVIFMWTMHAVSWMLNYSCHATQDSQKLTEGKCEEQVISSEMKQEKYLLCTYGKKFK